MNTGTATAVNASHLRILVVDDSEAMRRALRRVLERHVDWEVCAEASNGREALEKAAQCGPDVILLDFQMPVMNGLEAAEEMRRRTPEIPILMVTMHMSPQLVIEARKVGVRGTCSKTEIGCLMEAVQTLRQNGTYYRN